MRKIGVTDRHLNHLQTYLFLERVTYITLLSFIVKVVTGGITSEESDFGRHSHMGTENLMSLVISIYKSSSSCTSFFYRRKDTFDLKSQTLE